MLIAGLAFTGAILTTLLDPDRFVLKDLLDITHPHHEFLVVLFLLIGVVAMFLPGGER